MIIERGELALPFLLWRKIMSKWMVYAKKADFKAIAARYGIDQVIARIIRNRDVCTNEEIDMYLGGDISSMHDAHLLKDADKAADIIIDKINHRKHIRIVGDYDIDGVCSVTILLKGLKRAGADVDYTVPDRIADGYGINENIIICFFLLIILNLSFSFNRSTFFQRYFAINFSSVIIVVNDKLLRVWRKIHDKYLMPCYRSSAASASG